jgi:hypothetical protein
VSASLAVWGGELVYQAPHKLARSRSECAKVAINVQKERGRVVCIEGREGVARGGGKTEGNQAKTEGN